MKEDSVNLLKTCSKCKIHANEHHIPMSEYHTFGTPILFAQWGIDLLGPFPMDLVGKNYLIVAVNHFTR